MRTGGHWSRPAAMRTLDALMRLGGKGTTFQIQQITLSVAVHQDIYSLRCWLQFDRGYPERDTHLAVKRVELGKNASGRMVVRYELRPDVQALHRRLRAANRPQIAQITQRTEGKKASEVGQNTPAQTPGQNGSASPVVPSVTSAKSADSQSLLFETEDALSLRRKADRPQ